MSTELQTKVQASPAQNFTPVQTGLLQRKSALCNTPGLVEDSERDKEKLTLQRSSVDQAGATTMPRFGHDFSRVGVHSIRQGMIQTKLKINEPGDIYEQEADSVVEQVMAASAHPSVTGAPPRIQRFSGQSDRQMDLAPASVDHALASPGRQLDPALRQDMEQRFGHDFSQVRVHTGGAAEQSAWDVSAKAYTVGYNIVFGAGRFVPQTHEGRQLLAHELTHIVQQSQFENWELGVIRRAGFFESIARFFGGGTFSDKELKAYIEVIRGADQIEDKFDSDNKARSVVEKNMFQHENIRIRILLVQEMLSGFTGDDDEQAILKILEVATQGERGAIVNRIGIEKLYDNFHGKELGRLYLLFPVLDSLHPRSKKESKTYTLEKYIEKWDLEKGISMTDNEKETLARGCIGITALELGTLGNPDLSNCYNSFREALEAQKKMNDFLALHNPGRKALIFSKRFWSGEQKLKRDPTTGKVDLSTYDYKARPGAFTNYDYGLYDEKTGKWWHANHCDTTLLSEPECGGAMEVYESNLEYYSRGLLDFDSQVFCVGVAIRP